MDDNDFIILSIKAKESILRSNKFCLPAQELTIISIGFVGPQTFLKQKC